jgi:CubicO group peptidase (beta-lactamase class C family)
MSNGKMPSYHDIEELVPPVVVKGEAPKRTKLGQRMTQLQIPGLSVALIHDGKLAWAKGFGVAKKDGPPVTPDTLFQAASISKPLVAMAALHMVQTGALDLDTDVNKYLKTWKLPQNSFTKKTKVTLRMLLSHTGGTTVPGFLGYASDLPLPSVVQILNGEKPANSPPVTVDIQPGTLWRYSGGGYVVIQQLLDDLTGKPFPDIMQGMVLSPLDMSHSTFEQPLPPARAAEAATPYYRGGYPVPGGPHTYIEMAAGGLWTTPADLAKYLVEVQKSLTGASNKVLSQAMVQEMLKPGLGDWAPWGLGLEVGGSADHPHFGHDGGNEGFKCKMVAYNNGDGIIILTNSDDGLVIADEILRTVAYAYKWPDYQPKLRDMDQVVKVDPELLERYVGRYELWPNGSFEVTRRKGKLFSQFTGQARFQLFPTNDHEFFYKGSATDISFVTEGGGKANKLVADIQGKKYTAPRKEQ